MMKLIAYNEYSSGGMNGGYSSLAVERTQEGRCRVSTVNKPSHNRPAICERYYAEGLLEKLSELCEGCPVLTWKDLPDSEMRMHDAPDSQETFTFEDGTKISLGSRKIYPAQFHPLYSKMKELIKEARACADSVEVWEDRPLMTMGMMPCPPAPVQEAVESVQWAKFCAECGEKFGENQKYCARCGTMRQKR